MSRIWVEIETLAGERLGAILTAMDWSITPRQDLVGSFSFRMPAADPRAALVQEKRIARCWTQIGGVDTALGAGVIDNIEIEDGSPLMLTVSGDDLLTELTYRSVQGLALMTETSYTPIKVSLVVASPTGETDLPNAYDGDAGTSDSATLLYTSTPNQWMYVRHTDTFSKTEITLGATVNSNTGELAAQYYNGDTGGWEQISITEDTTNPSGTVPLAQSGSITWSMPAGWGPVGAEYIVRFYAKTADLGPVDLAEVTAVTVEATSTALADIMAYAPDGWSLDTVHGYGSTGKDVYLQFAGESVLAALQSVAEQTGEHFILSYSGRQVLWLRDTRPSTGVYALQANDVHAAMGNDRICLIQDGSLAELRDSYDLISRIYPHGGGTGRARPSLADISSDKKDEIELMGFAVDKDANFIDYEAAAEYYGARIERDVAWSDINAKDTSQTQRTHASDALADRAVEYLRRHSAGSAADVPRTYRLGVVKVDRALWPGHTIHVQYRKVVDGYTALDIDRELIILEATHQVAAGGLRTTTLQVSTIDRWPEDDGSVVANSIQNTTANVAHETPQQVVSSASEGIVVKLDVDEGMVVGIRRAGKAAAISDPSGGATNDAQARAAIVAILAALRNAEIIA